MCINVVAPARAVAWLDADEADEGEPRSRCIAPRTSLQKGTVLHVRELVERADREVEHLIARFHPILWPYATACCSRRSRVWYAFKVLRPSRSR